MDFRQELNNLCNQDDEQVFDFELTAFSQKLYDHRSSIPILYRYMPANYFSIRSLEQGNIFLSEAGKMNDIFEGLSSLIDDYTQERVNDLSDLVYLKSFSECFDNLLMWGTYADNYAGMCVEYDLRNMKKDYYWHLFPVYYLDKRYNTKTYLHHSLDELRKYKFDPEDCDAEFLRDIYSLYLAKSQFWNYEKEWRIVVPHLYMREKWHEGGFFESDEEPFLYSINAQTIDFPYVSKVYLGPRVPSLQKEHIVEICKNKKIPVYKSKPSLNQFKLDYTQL